MTEVRRGPAERPAPFLLYGVRRSHGYWGTAPAIVLLVRYLGQTSGHAQAAIGARPAAFSPPESPKDIPKRRYASGEIDRDEYLQKLGDL